MHITDVNESWYFNGDGGTKLRLDDMGHIRTKQFIDMTDEELLDLSLMKDDCYEWAKDTAIEELARRHSTEIYDTVTCAMELKK